MRDSTRKLITEARVKFDPREAELKDLEFILKTEASGEIRKAARRRYLELTDKEPA